MEAAHKVWKRRILYRLLRFSTVLRVLKVLKVLRVLRGANMALT